MDASSGGDCEPELRGRLFLTAHEGPVQARQLLWKETVEGSVDAGAKRCVHL